MCSSDLTVKYDSNGDGTADTTWYDADGDGVKDTNYVYSSTTTPTPLSELKMSDNRMNNITNWPTSSGKKVTYDNLSSDQITKVQGIYYCNHALGYYTAKGPDYFDGALICQNEALIFNTGIYFRYDPRVHSRYQGKYLDSDPNRIIDLGLPIAEKVAIIDRYEVASGK